MDPSGRGGSYFSRGLISEFYGMYIEFIKRSKNQLLALIVPLIVPRLAWLSLSLQWPPWLVPVSQWLDTNIK